MIDSFHCRGDTSLSQMEIQSLLISELVALPSVCIWSTSGDLSSHIFSSHLHTRGSVSESKTVPLPFQINHRPDAKIFQFIILTFIYSATCFGRSPAHRQELDACSGSLWFYLRIVVIAVLCSWSGRSRTQHGYHHDTTVKPGAATIGTELLTMGERTPETCWAVNKRQDNKLENFCIWSVIYLNCTTMHGLNKP
jgi:hypothetical protein